jgi:3-hydroxyisobutyrate dehydrogenase-like beta-hydroxyacid dehydrogenase
VIVVIGLGNIGGAMARRLVDAGQDVCGVDLSEERREEWRQDTGLEAIGSLTAAPWERADQVLVIVRLTHQAEEILQQLRTLPIRPGTLVLLSTTLELDYARELARYDDAQYRLVELPVSGGMGRALQGTLTVLAAGPLTEDDEKYLLSTLASNVVHFGKFGDPTVAKLVNNVTAAYNARAYADMLILGEELGLDATKLAEVLETSSGGSWMGSAFMVLQDELLEKDVALLRDRLNGLPTISLALDQDLVGRLQQARARLQ